MQVFLWPPELSRTQHDATLFLVVGSGYLDVVAGLFYRVGKAVGPKLRKGKWVWNSLTASEEEIIRAEHETGRDMAAALTAETPVSEDAEAVQRVTEWGGQLAGRLTDRRRRWAFGIVAAERPNAWALPGGFVFITQSLVDLCGRDPDEIAFVLGHEMGHVTRGHAFDRLVSSTLLGAASAAAPVGRLLTPRVMQVGMKLMQSAYSQDQEMEADSFGARLARSGGFDPRGAIRMMERLQAEHGSGRLPELFSYFSTHPPFATRITQLKRLLK